MPPVCCGQKTQKAAVRVGGDGSNPPCSSFRPAEVALCPTQLPLGNPCGSVSCCATLVTFLLCLCEFMLVLWAYNVYQGGRVLCLCKTKQDDCLFYSVLTAPDTQYVYTTVLNEKMLNWFKWASCQCALICSLSVNKRRLLQPAGMSGMLF